MDYKRTFIIAEAGVNHNGSLDRAGEMIDAAAEAGADAVKFQSFKAERIVSMTAPKAEYQKETTDPGESQYEMIRRLELDRESHRALIRRCEERKVRFLSTPFDMDSLDMLLSEFKLPMVKISSGDITNAPLLLEAARRQRPVILSTGMSSLADIEIALGVLAFGYTEGIKKKPSVQAFRRSFLTEKGQKALKKRVTLLHCTTEYPAPFEEVNLHAMEVMRSAFGLPVGYSDHTTGIAVAVAAVALGAVVIEKHFTLDRTLPGPDHKASLEPGELKAMIESIRQVEPALGLKRKIPAASELKNRAVAQKSLVAAVAIGKGECFTEENVAVKRPGNGLSPVFYWDVVGRPAQKDYAPDEAILP
jgi:N-acetylneuraminate synthase